MAGGLLLKDFRVVITALHNSEKDSVQARLQEQGAVLLTVVTSNDPPHLIITRRAGTPKYVAALKRNPNTPVVTPEWLSDSIKEGRRLAYDPYALSTLQGLTICFSGLQVDVKKDFATQIAQLGGKHSASLDIQCTHLVTVSTDSDKYKWAKMHKITVVTPEWLIDTIQKGICQDDRHYQVDSHHTGIETLSRQHTMQEGSLMRASQETGAAAETTTAGGLQRSGSMRLKTSAAVDTPVENINPDSLPVEYTFDDLTCDDSVPPFLDACYMWVVGCSQEEMVQVMKISRHGAAKRFTTPVPTLTHIVVGSQVDRHIEELSSIVAKQRTVTVVTLDWLIQCGASQEMISPNNYLYTIPTAQSRLEAYKRQQSSAGPLGEGVSLLGTGSDTNNTLSRQPSLPTGCFANCYFTLAAIKKTPAEAIAEHLIRSNGGRIFTSSLPATVTHGIAKAYAICPHSLTPQQATALRTNNPDFAAVDESARYTVYWLECSAKINNLMPYSRGTPCFKPLPYTLPIPGMDKVSVAISGYQTVVRDAIQKVVEVVGGKVSVQSMSSKDTHLIVDAARGEKYKHAARLGVKPVTAEWLLESVAVGRLQNEAHFAPLPPSHSQMASATQLPATGPSQVVTTQPTSLRQRMKLAYNTGAGSMPPPPRPAAAAPAVVSNEPLPAQTPLFDDIFGSGADNKANSKQADPASAAISSLVNPPPVVAPVTVALTAPPPPPVVVPVSAAKTPQGRQLNLTKPTSPGNTAAPTGTGKRSTGREKKGNPRRSLGLPSQPPPPSTTRKTRTQSQQPRPLVVEPPPPPVEAADTETELEAVVNALLNKVKQPHNGAIPHSQELGAIPLPTGGKRPLSRAGSAAAASKKRSRTAAGGDSQGITVSNGRRSTRGTTTGSEAEMPIEMSQQVGYDTADVPASRATRSRQGGDEAKQRLRQIATRARGGN